ncbi:MAG: alpha-L-arabinofuranosidase C-terminal domain-containing protein [Clostridiales bacterium]|nr:alpha-L-arabinofuranosidase C-terminal domain-containing protein [Clostridiales bacterium]
MSAKIKLNAANTGAVINRNIYGHFSEHLGRCIYGGLFVGEDSPIPNKNGMRTDVVEALRNIRVPVLRWPGGCFADEYHWEDGIGPKESRKRMVNTNWGGVVEDNSFGTHEFLELCEQLGCEPYINANVGSGTVREMAEWVEYLNSEGDSTVVKKRWANGRKDPWNVKYLGVGNESWGCGGNMRPEYYADEFRRYSTFCRNYGTNKLYRIACGPNAGDWAWTETLMKNAAAFCDAITLHYYTVPTGEWEDKGSATEFDSEMYYATLRGTTRMEKLLEGHLAIMDKYDPKHKVGLIVDEWGTWYNVEPGTNPGFLYQQNTMRDAMVAAINLNLFNSHADRVVMANIAQTVNVLQSVILTDGDQMLLTPTYHVFDLYKAHQDATLVPVTVACDTVEGVQQVTASASIKEGVLTVTAANVAADKAEKVVLDIAGFDVKDVSIRILSGDMHDKNTFEDKERVTIADFTDFEVTGEGVVLNLPGCSVVEVTVRG